MQAVPGASLDVTAGYSPRDRVCHSRHKTLDAYQMVELHDGDGDHKSHRYGRMLRAMLADQLAWIADHAHQRRITEANGRDALVVAREADRLARTERSDIAR